MKRLIIDDDTLAERAATSWRELSACDLIKQSSLSTVVYDPEGHPIKVNRAFEKMWGVPLSSAPAGYSVLTDPELGAQGVLPVIRRAFEQGEVVVTPPVRYDISKLSGGAGGSVLWTQGHFYPILGSKGDVRLVILTHIDLTDRMVGESELLRTLADLEHLQSLTAALGGARNVEEVAAVVLERALPAFGAEAGFVNLVSDSGTEMVNVRAVGFTDEQLKPFRRYPLNAPLAGAEVIRKGEPIFITTIEEAERRFPLVQGPLRAQGYHSLATLPLRSKDRVFGIIAFNFRKPNAFDAAQRDLMIAFAGQCAIALERARLYEAEQRARIEAEHANSAKAGFLATMSHELRTPLTAIDGYAELMEMGIHGPLTDAQAEDLRRIRRSQKHLLTLINDLLGFARLESGHIHVHLADISLEDALASAVELVAPQANTKGIAIRFDRDSTRTRVRADDEKLRQIALNLLSNAIKFTDQGHVAVTVRTESDRAIVEFMDNGRGIPADRLDDIFEPFVQVDRGLTRNTGGTGLGLTIARDLARRMNASLTVRSVMERGSVFTLTLPLAA